MDVNRKELSTIKRVLKDNPWGMTVTEISKAIGMNRHSVAKYLEVLVAAGHVDMKTFGPSKVYYLSQRVPLSAMLSLSSDLIVILDKDMRIRNVNDKFLEFVKLDREEMLNKNIENFKFTRRIEPSLFPGIKHALDGKEQNVDAYYHYEHEEYYFIVKFIPTVFEDGEKGVTIIMSDVTARKRIENAVVESEHKFRDMLEQSTDAIMMTDEKGTIAEYSKSCELLTGYSKSQAIGKPIWEMPIVRRAYEQIPKKKKGKLEDGIRTFLKSGNASMLDRHSIFDIERQDGGVRTVHANVFPIKTGKGYMLCAIAHDITSIKKAEMAIKENEEKFRNLAETTTSGILIIQDDKIVYANNAAETITGYGKEELFSTSMMSIIHPEYKGVIDSYMGHIRAGTKVLKTPVEIKIIKKSREIRWVDVTLGTMSLNGRIAVIKTFFDVTESIEAEEALRREHDMLEYRVKERTAELENANKTLTAEIEKRKSSEAALRKSETRYRNLVENVNDWVWETDSTGLFIYSSPTVLEMLGYHPEEIIGMRPFDLMEPEKGKKMYYRFIDIARNGEQFTDMEAEHQHKDGRSVFAESSGMPIRDTAGTVIGYTGITRDVTDRKTAEEKLLRTTSELKVIFNAFPDIVVRVGKDGTILDYSPGSYVHAHVNPPTFIGKKIRELLPEDRGNMIMEAVGRTYSSGQMTIIEITMKIGDNEDIFEVRVVPTVDNQIIFIARPITAQKHMEKALRESEEKFRSLVESINDVAWEKDQNARFVYMSPNIREMAGYEPSDFIGKTILDFMPPQEAEKIHDEFWRMFREPRPYSLQKTVILDKSGREVIAEANGIPWYDDHGNFMGYRGVTRNVTSRAVVEDALRRSNRALELVMSCDRMIARAKDEKTLLEDICRTIVEKGGYRMAWVGYAENDDKKSIRSIARSGLDNGYVDIIDATLAGMERGMGPTGTSIRTAKVCIVSSVPDDPQFKPWREGALKLGFASSISLPLVSQGRAFGALCIYSASKDAFDSQEVKLLKSLTDDLVNSILLLRACTPMAIKQARYEN